MDIPTKEKVGKQLLKEIDTVFQYYFRQTLDEVITELRIRCIIAGRTNNAVNLISEIHNCGVLNTNSETPVKYLRRAIERFASDSFGLCSHCGASIPEDWLLRSPLVEYCSHCMLQARPSYEKLDVRTDELHQTSAAS